MATRQDAYTLIDHLDERDLQKVVDYILCLHPAPENRTAEIARSMEAFEQLEKMRKTLSKRIPADFDYEAARAEAVEEKYGRFD